MEALRLTKQDDGRVVGVSSRGEIVLTLPESPTTGYRWQLGELDERVLKRGESTFEPDSRAVGSGGVRVFHVTAVGEGEATLRAKHWREWAGDSSVTERFEVTVRVAH